MVILLELKQMLETPPFCDSLDAMSAEQIFQQCDISGDGEIDFEEFMGMMRQEEAKKSPGSAKIPTK